MRRFFHRNQRRRHLDTSHVTRSLRFKTGARLAVLSLLSLASEKIA